MRQVRPSLLIAIFFAVASTGVRADHGERFFRTTCDPPNGVYELEPLMIWNEELDSLTATLRQNDGIAQVGVAKYYGKEHIDAEVNELCRIGNENLSLVVERYDYSFRVLQNSELIADIAISTVWQMYSWVFKIRYKAGEGWQESCGDVDMPHAWRPLDRMRSSTDSGCTGPSAPAN